MSLFRYFQCLFKNHQSVPLLKNTLKLSFCSTSDKSGCGSSSDKSKPEKDTGTSSLHSEDSPKPELLTYYDSRKYGHNLPSNNVKPDFETLPDIPTGVFRCTADEILGSGDDDGVCYQNPEYFSFHHMSYYDMHLALRRYRKTSPDTGRKK